MRQIYLDYNATTPVAPSVLEAMLPFLSTHHGNPSSDHTPGRIAAQAVDDARERIAQLLDCAPEEIVFTSGGTESNNLAIKGLMTPSRSEPPAHMVISAIEHPAVHVPAEFLTRWGVGLTYCPVTEQGTVAPDRLADCLRDDTRLVSIMHANNEIGTVQPIREIADICHERGILVHSDAAQSVGKIRVSVDELGVDLLTLAGHKMYAPKGVGALYVRRGVSLESLLHGAAHEWGLRAGTENVPYLVGLGTAAHLAARSTNEMSNRLAGLRDYLWQELARGIPGLVEHGAGAPRLPNTLSVSFPHTNARALLERVPEICASTGAACHSGEATVSNTMRAMGVDAERAQGTVRFSLGWQTSKDEIERAAAELIQAWQGLQV